MVPPTRGRASRARLSFYYEPNWRPGSPVLRSNQAMTATFSKNSSSEARSAAQESWRRAQEPSAISCESAAETCQALRSTELLRILASLVCGRVARRRRQRAGDAFERVAGGPIARRMRCRGGPGVNDIVIRDLVLQIVLDVACEPFEVAAREPLAPIEVEQERELCPNRPRLHAFPFHCLPIDAV